MIEQEFIAKDFKLKEEIVIGKFKFYIYDILDWPKHVKVYNYSPGNMDVYYDNKFLFNSNKCIKMYLKQKNAKHKSDLIYEVEHDKDTIIKFYGNLFIWDFDMISQRIVSRLPNR